MSGVSPCEVALGAMTAAFEAGAAQDTAVEAGRLILSAAYQSRNLTISQYSYAIEEIHSKASALYDRSPRGASAK